MRPPPPPALKPGAPQPDFACAGRAISPMPPGFAGPWALPVRRAGLPPRPLAAASNTAGTGHIAARAARLERSWRAGMPPGPRPQARIFRRLEWGGPGARACRRQCRAAAACGLLALPLLPSTATRSLSGGGGPNLWPPCPPTPPIRPNSSPPACALNHPAQRRGMPNRARPAAFARQALPALALLAAFLVAAAAACLRGPKRQFRHSSFRQHSPQPPRFRRAPARHSYSTPQNACCARGPARRTAARIGRGRQPRAQLRSFRPRSQIARRACVPRAGRRQAAAAMRFGAGGGGGGLAVALLPPPRVSPAPPRSRVPRGHAAGHFAADSYMPATRPAGGGGSPPPGPIDAWYQGAAGETGHRRRGESIAHFQALGPFASPCLRMQPSKLPQPPARESSPIAWRQVHASAERQLGLILDGKAHLPSPTHLLLL